MVLLSPLRYPGGKTKIYSFIEHTIKVNNIKNCIYIEPFCGGAGVALKLLIENKVDNIILNDYDIGVYSFWKAILEEKDRLIEKIRSTNVTIEERTKQKEIFKEKTKIRAYNFDLAFATLFLNRVNISGILNGGVIGGKKQDGTNKINARFNKEKLIQKIEVIYSFKNKIRVFNSPILEFILSDLPKIKNKENMFIFLDPPYYNQGKKLYNTFFLTQDHINFRDGLKYLKQYHWILTYDNDKFILDLFKKCNPKLFEIQYSANKKTKTARTTISQQ